MADANLLALTLGLAGAVLVALTVDWHWGEPTPRWHPVVWIGRYLGVIGPRIRQAQPVSAFVLGTLAWSLGAVVVVVAAIGMQALVLYALGQLPWKWSASFVAAFAIGVLLKPLLAWRLLHDEVAAIEAALGEGLAPARARLARVVSRDTAELDPTAIREAAIETLAENLNDSVIAPLFWFAVAGLPGAALYRYANTADAMWGYRGEWEWSGKCAARMDDLLSWLPARLTAALIGVGAVRWSVLRHEAQHTPSPNGGWAMGAMALRLGVRLGKPGVYALHAEGRSPEAHDVHAALAIARRAMWRGAAVAVMLLAALSLVALVRDLA